MINYSVKGIIINQKFNSKQGILNGQQDQGRQKTPKILQKTGRKIH